VKAAFANPTDRARAMPLFPISPSPAPRSILYVASVCRFALGNLALAAAMALSSRLQLPLVAAVYSSRRPNLDDDAHLAFLVTALEALGVPAVCVAAPPPDLAAACHMAFVSLSVTADMLSFDALSLSCAVDAAILLIDDDPRATQWATHVFAPTFKALSSFGALPVAVVVDGTCPLPLRVPHATSIAHISTALQLSHVAPLPPPFSRSHALIASGIVPRALYGCARLLFPFPLAAAARVGAVHLGPAFSSGLCRSLALSCRLFWPRTATDPSLSLASLPVTDRIGLTAPTNLADGLSEIDLGVLTELLAALAGQASGRS
jgi:hypothetical protein